MLAQRLDQGVPAGAGADLGDDDQKSASSWLAIQAAWRRARLGEACWALKTISRSEPVAAVWPVGRGGEGKLAGGGHG